MWLINHDERDSFHTDIRQSDMFSFISRTGWLTFVEVCLLSLLKCEIYDSIHTSINMFFYFSNWLIDIRCRSSIVSVRMLNKFMIHT